MFYIDCFYKPQNSSLKWWLLVWTLRSGRMVIVTRHFSFAVSSPRPPAEGYRGRRRMDGVLLWCSVRWWGWRLRHSRYETSSKAHPGWAGGIPLGSLVDPLSLSHHQQGTLNQCSLFGQLCRFLSGELTWARRTSTSLVYSGRNSSATGCYMFHTNREIRWVSWARGLKRQPLPSNAHS